jgi:hypothetical protein
MASLHLRYQLAVVLLGGALFRLLLLSGLHDRLFSRKFLYRFRHWPGVLFFAYNLCGVSTTNLLSMTYLHITEQMFLIFLFICDLYFCHQRPTRLIHHVLGIIGLALQIHIGIGGAMMSYLLIDQVTDLISDVRAFWITFFVVRLLAYNVVMFVAVRQALGPAKESRAVMGWFVCVLIWWVFSLCYHLRWIWRERKGIIWAFSSGQQTDEEAENPPRSPETFPEVVKLPE